MSGMIRRLRWKIVGISMLFVTLVLAAVFTGVMLTARSSLVRAAPGSWRRPCGERATTARTANPAS